MSAAATAGPPRTANVRGARRERKNQGCQLSEGEQTDRSRLRQRRPGKRQGFSIYEHSVIVLGAQSGLGRFAGRLTAVYLLVGGVMVLDILGLRAVPSWLLHAGELEGWGVSREVLAGAATILVMLVEVVLWPVLGFALLLGPVVVIEEGSVGSTLGQWWQLLRQHLGRVFLYEALATALGVVATLPFVLPVLLTALGASAAWDYLPWRFTVWLLGGLAAAPLLAYLVVANVFIYLNLRYEQGTRR